MPGLRQTLISRPLMKWVGSVLPEMSDTEAQAIEAGTVWWDKELMSGKPDWAYLQGLKAPTLREDERAFIEGPLQKLLAMLDDWEIEHEQNDLPREVWDFLISEGFFAMIIPQDYGGKGFSAYAHSEIVRAIGTRSVTAAVTVMVPNSLGPGELLMLYGTQDQRDHYLPRLASGKDIPCFALTGVEAGSDASEMTDVGVVCERMVNGEKTLGVAITCEKRYITLAPVATLAGLAFQMRDPDGLLGEEEDLGITVALVPTDTPGLETGERHAPAGLAFQNGPITGKDVFVPLDQILGGREMIGQGWKMLMGALAAGRGISLPSLSAASCALTTQTTGAYAAVRRQFGRPIGDFEGVREPLARIAARAYLVDGARTLTTRGIDLGEKPAVISAIMKYHATERMREATNDAMDVHGGKAICEGPKNYLAHAYKAVPIGITVEGANIVTRSLIIFGQGSIRCHPYLVDEIKAVSNPDKKAGLKAFDKALFGHVGYLFANLGRSLLYKVTGSRFAAAPEGAGDLKAYYQRLSRISTSLAMASEVAFVAMGGALKRKESISARYGDILSELYLLCGALKRFEDDARPEEDRALLDYCFAEGMQRVHQRFHDIARNFPNPFWRTVLRLTTPTGRVDGPSDKEVNAVAALAQRPGATRDRLTRGVYAGKETEVGRLEAAFAEAERADALEAKLRKAGQPLSDAVEAGVLTSDEARDLQRIRGLIREVIQVDAFEAASRTEPQKQAA